MLPNHTIDCFVTWFLQCCIDYPVYLWCIFTHVSLYQDTLQQFQLHEIAQVCYVAEQGQHILAVTHGTSRFVFLLVSLFVCLFVFLFVCLFVCFKRFFSTLIRHCTTNPGVLSLIPSLTTLDVPVCALGTD